MPDVIHSSRLSTRLGLFFPRSAALPASLLRSAHCASPQAAEARASDASVSVELGEVGPAASASLWRRRQVCVPCRVLVLRSLHCSARLLPPPNAGLLNPSRGPTVCVSGSGGSCPGLAACSLPACLLIRHDAMRSSRPLSIKPTSQPREAVDRGPSGPHLDQGQKPTHTFATGTPKIALVPTPERL